MLLLSLPVGFATTAVLTGNNIRDLEEDDEARIITLVRLGGPKIGRFIYIGFVVSSVLALAIFAFAGIVPRILVAAPPLLILLRKVLRDVWQGRRLVDIDAQTARFESVLLVFLLIAFVISASARAI